jgi:drug/metabolite transporter (DMT)-like permease
VWVLKEPFRPSLAIGSVAALAGLALLTNAFAAGFHTSLYDGLAVLTAIASAYIVITIRLLHQDGEHTTTIFAAQCVYGLLICAGPAISDGLALDGRTWALMLLAGVCAAIGQLAMTRAFRDVPVAEGSLIQILVPVGIAIGGVVFFHEHFTVHEVVGAALIVAGTLFATPRGSR